ncbi:MAG: SDR family NAD(P)-dependent oxidoreductase [Spirochaetes bacterium]|nr:SDR family NAD(P)-dependent oxidoreductase [Spirochaetota bacterium]
MRSIGAFAQRYGPWALIAGGSDGLGAAFAEELAGRGLNLLLVARRPGPLKEIAARLSSRHDVQVRAVSLDISNEGFLAALQRETADLEIGLLVCNAAAAHTAPFLEAGPADLLPLLYTNCRAHLLLIRWLGEVMAQRRRGGIVVMTSMSAFQGSPFVTVYAATKAFLLNLAEGVASELAPFGVDVLSCAAGPIRTPNYIASKEAAKGPKALEMEPREVALAALRGLGRKTLVVPGRLNRLALFFMGRLLPRAAAVGLIAHSTRAMYGGRT